LAALLERRTEQRDRAILILIEWLKGASDAGRGRPIVRNFAAYVLGMIRATDAQDALAAAARDDQGHDVRVYAICALGKLRSRRHLSLLVKLRSKAANEQERRVIGQAICRIMGVAYYDP
jgi:HEAT repeat protein